MPVVIDNLDNSLAFSSFYSKVLLSEKNAKQNPKSKAERHILGRTKTVTMPFHSGYSLCCLIPMSNCFLASTGSSLLQACHGPLGMQGWGGLGGGHKGIDLKITGQLWKSQSNQYSETYACIFQTSAAHVGFIPCSTNTLFHFKPLS